MIIQHIKHHSQALGRPMEFKVYGYGGKPVIFIPCQCGRYYDFENFHMHEHWAPWIDAGLCTIFAIDVIDGESWAGFDLTPEARTDNLEKWYHYVVDELVPTIYSSSGRRDILTFGCSLGGMHAANLFFRRPDLFDAVFAISGLYDSEDFFGSYMDERLYNNCPALYLANLPQDHPYLSVFSQRKMLITVGQGAWEGPLLESTRRLDTVCKRKGIPVRFEYWGLDVDHDWPWWFKMVEVYAPIFLEQ